MAVLIFSPNHQETTPGLFHDGPELLHKQLRFRLDDDGVAPDGVGEEKSVPIFLVLSYRPAERSSVSLLAGMNFYGSVSVFDDRGKKIAGEDYDPTPFLGLAFSLTF